MPTMTVTTNAGFDLHSVLIALTQEVETWDDALGDPKPIKGDDGFRAPLGDGYSILFQGEFNKKFTKGDPEHVTLFKDGKSVITFTEFGRPLSDFMFATLLVTATPAAPTSIGGALTATLLSQSSKQNPVSIFGGDGADVAYYLGTGVGRLFGRAGNDTMEDNIGQVNKYDGETGKDTVAYITNNTGVTVNLADATQNKGEAAGDTYFSIENVTGTAQDDVLTGNALKNVLRGEGGNDILDGGTRTDTLYGGEGADTFVFNGPGTTADVKSIMDFDALDHIQLSRTGFGLHPQYQLTVGTTLIMAQSNPVATTNSPTFLIDQTTGELFFDADGNGSGEKQLIANVKFVGQEFLQLNDFVIV